MSKLFTGNPAIATFAFCLATASSGLVQAGIVQNMSGNHRAVAQWVPGADETVNFGVYRRDGVRRKDKFGTGLAGFDTEFVRGRNSPQLDTSARYLYLYQVVNDGPGSLPFRVAGLGVPRSSITSWGSWDLALRDNSGVVGPNNQFGLDGARFVPDAPANTGINSPGVRRVSRYQERPTVRSLSNGLQVQWQLDRGETSWIFGFTSNYAPYMWRPNPATSANDWAIGAHPIPNSPTRVLALSSLTQIDLSACKVPEPASVGLAMFGLGSLVIFRVRRGLSEEVKLRLS